MLAGISNLTEAQVGAVYAVCGVAKFGKLAERLPG